MNPHLKFVIRIGLHSLIREGNFLIEPFQTFQGGLILHKVVFRVDQLLPVIERCGTSIVIESFHGNGSGLVLYVLLHFIQSLRHSAEHIQQHRFLHLFLFLFEVFIQFLFKVFSILKYVLFVFLLFFLFPLVILNLFLHLLHFLHCLFIVLFVTNFLSHVKLSEYCQIRLEIIEQHV